MITINVRKVRAIEDAELEIFGITVLAGGNGCGKSTISKLLYYILDTSTRFDTFVARETTPKIRELFTKTVDLILNLTYQIESLNEQDRHSLFPHSNDMMHPKGWLARVRRFFAEKSDELCLSSKLMSNFFVRVQRLLRNDADSIYDGSWRSIQDALLSVEEGISRIEQRTDSMTYARPLDVLDNRLGQVFEESVDLRNVDVCLDRESLIKVESKRLDAPVDIQRVFYIDTPWVLDSIDVRDSQLGRRDGRLEHREHLIKTLQSVHGVADLPLFDLMRNVVHGRVKAAKTPVGYRFQFESEDFDRVFNLFHCATGVKAFSILQMLLAAGRLDSSTLLILDEPESNLHPQWVVEYARVIVFLRSMFGVRFLISTHSTDFVAAIQSIAKKEKVSEDVRFYVAEQMPSKRYRFKGLGFDIGEIFDSFNLSLNKIAEYGDEV